MPKNGPTRGLTMRRVAGHNALTHRPAHLHMSYWVLLALLGGWTDPAA